MAARAATAAAPRYIVSPSPSSPAFDRRTVSRPVPSGLWSTSAHVIAAASDRRSMASRMTVARAMSTAPLTSTAHRSSVAPLRLTLGRLAVARMAASTPAVRAVACCGRWPWDACASCIMVAATTGADVGSSCPAALWTAAMAALRWRMVARLRPSACSISR